MTLSYKISSFKSLINRKKPEPELKPEPARTGTGAAFRNFSSGSRGGNLISPSWFSVSARASDTGIKYLHKVLKNQMWCS
jgi:hypothetical protein